MEGTRPKGSVRSVLLFGLFSFSTALLSWTNYTENIAYNKIPLLITLGLLAVLVIYEICKIVNLKGGSESVLLIIITTLLFASGILLLLVLEVFGIFIWNEFELTLPLFLFSSSIFLACLYTEKKNKIRIYLSLTGHKYIKFE